jgi:hypothetical protein
VPIVKDGIVAPPAKRDADAALAGAKVPAATRAVPATSVVTERNLIFFPPRHGIMTGFLRGFAAGLLATATKQQRSITGPAPLNFVILTLRERTVTNWIVQYQGHDRRSSRGPH